MKTTSAKCSHAEKEYIRTVAHRKGYDMRSYVSNLLDKHLPIDAVKIFPKDIPRDKTVGVLLTPELRDRLYKNMAALSTDFAKVKMFEMVLTCVILEDE